MRESFAEFLDGAHDKLALDQDSFLSEFQINSFELWDYDRDSGVFSLFRKNDSIHFTFQAIGKFSEKTGHWQWAWDDESLHPHEKVLARSVKNFGQKNGYELLTTPKWETERDEGWDILAIVHKVQNNLGYYRIPQDDEHMFVAFTQELSLDEAESRITGSTELVLCEKHGLQRAAYVCSHLVEGKSLGFNEPYSKIPMFKPDETEALHAWCDECEEVRAKEGEWNQEAEAFANVQLVCEECFKEIKERNKHIK